MTFLTWLITTAWTLGLIWMAYELRRAPVEDRSEVLTQLHHSGRTEFVTTKPHPACNAETQALALTAEPLEFDVGTEPRHNRTTVVRACRRLQADTGVQWWQGRKGADHTAIYDISVPEHLRLLKEDPQAYER
jgi:hypothetical protein